MKVPIYQVDAFTDRLFAGNPAAVCPLETWLEDATMQAIAAENNLSETAFFVRGKDGYDLRWFTPVCEVDLCGHATLASAFVIFRLLDTAASAVRFSTRGGPLTVERAGRALRMRLPRWNPEPCAAPVDLLQGLGAAPDEILRTRDVLAVFASPEIVRSLRPDARHLARIDATGIIATAPGPHDGADFVLRFFAPSAGILEDPATGSALCTLVPYWSRRLARARVQARQLSARGALFDCEDLGDAVVLTGHAVLYLTGSIEL